MMKAKLLHGIVKDLLKFPMHHEEEGMEKEPFEKDPKGEAHITVIAAGKPSMEDDGDGDDDMESGMDPVAKAKKMVMEKAIHAKSKDKMI